MNNYICGKEIKAEGPQHALLLTQDYQTDTKIICYKKDTTQHSLVYFSFILAYLLLLTLVLIKGCRKNSINKKNNILNKGNLNHDK